MLTRKRVGRRAEELYGMFDEKLEKEVCVVTEISKWRLEVQVGRSHGHHG